MAVQFLSEEWAAAYSKALGSHDGFQGAISGANLGLQFNVSDAPSGPVGYYISISNGSADVALGELEAADATISSDYETAAGISKGEMNTQTAFMTGKIKVTGNLAVLMMNQSIISQWGAAGESLDVDY
jgi:putative sterol carrier protein